MRAFGMGLAGKGALTARVASAAGLRPSGPAGAPTRSALHTEQPTAAITCSVLEAIAGAGWTSHKPEPARASRTSGSERERAWHGETTEIESPHSTRGAEVRLNQDGCDHDGAEA